MPVLSGVSDEQDYLGVVWGEDLSPDHWRDSEGDLSESARDQVVFVGCRLGYHVPVRPVVEIWPG